MLITQKWEKPIKVLKCEHKLWLNCLEACFLSGKNEEERQCPTCKINTLKADNSPSSDLQTLLPLLKIQKQPPRGVLRKTCFENMQQFTGEHPCRSVISIKLLCNFIEITLRLECSSTNLLHIIGTPFTRNPSERLLLKMQCNTCTKM